MGIGIISSCFTLTLPPPNPGEHNVTLERLEARVERLSRLELGLRILQRFALPENLVDSGSRLDFPGKGARPGDLAFNLSPLEGKLNTRPATLAEQLEEMSIPDDLYDWFRDNSTDPSRYLRKFSIN